MEHHRHLSIFSLYALILVLRYLTWWEGQIKNINRRVHWVGDMRPEWIYPERKKYLFRVLQYHVHLWISVNKKDAPFV